MVTPQYEKIVGGASASVTLSGLEPGITYRIRVWSTDGTSVSSEAGEMDVATVESGELQSLKCIYLAHHSVYVLWLELQPLTCLKLVNAFQNQSSHLKTSRPISKPVDHFKTGQID